MILGIAIASTFAMGTVRRVPQEYLTIQSALDACMWFDTVMVAPGIYHEFLHGPEVTFTLSGEHEPVGNPDLWSLLDPIPLPDADTPSCLSITADTAFIKNIAFFNRVEYRETESGLREPAVCAQMVIFSAWRTVVLTPYPRPRAEETEFI
ncbi:MAG: hypothetical protein IPG71_04440 [bacterium]|nr:hypothetical protein [bacterium]